MRPTLYQMSYIRHHAIRGRTNEWIARRLEMTPHDVFVALLEMTNVDQQESQGQASLVRPLPGKGG